VASIDAAREAALKGAQLNRQLLAFARRQPLQARSVAPMALISNMRSMLARTIGENVEIKLADAADTWLIHVDPVQLESALLNLAVNARDAMPSGGTLTIETTTFAVAHDARDSLPELPPGDYVVISVTDSGAGIAPEHQSLIFEPFFTTKAAGEGTGLGLSMIYGFVKQSGGTIRFHSDLGAGTTMRLYFPRDVAGKDVGMVEAEVAAPTPCGRDETVLVLEDNLALRMVVISQLNSLGYRTIEAVDAETALARLHGEPKIDLLFTDIVMPGGMDGIELARTARTIRPKLKVMYTSGFAGAQAATLGRDIAGNLLNKPYRKLDLARRLREALDSE
jgi:CheY-like chemotaxis protein